MGNVDDDGRADDIVLRCYTLSSDGNTATYSSMMKLVDFGHCQTLEYYTWNGTTYFLMSCRYTSTSYTNTNGNPYYWATEICRVHYNAGTQLSYALCDRLINIDRANYNGTSYGTVKRVDGALSTDKADLLIWCRSITNVMQFSVYSFDEINELWDSPGATAVSCNNSVVKEACLSAEYPTSGSVFRLTESSSMQGLELNNADYTFIANGSSNANMYIVKLNWDCDMVSTIKISNSALSAGHNMEIEGLQLKGDYVYFGVCNHNIQNTGVQYIYSVSKNAF